jgi:signal transduction histidine kinase
VNRAARGNGLGLRSMRERAERLSADFSISSPPGRGTLVRLSVPLGGRLLHRRPADRGLRM